MTASRCSRTASSSRSLPRGSYDSPVNEFVAGFIGSPSMNLFPSDGVTLGVRPEAMRVVAEEICRAAGELTRWRRLVDRRARLLAVAPSPGLLAAVVGERNQWDALDDADFDRLLALLAPDAGVSADTAAISPLSRPARSPTVM